MEKQDRKRFERAVACAFLILIAGCGGGGGGSAGGSPAAGTPAPAAPAATPPASPPVTQYAVGGTVTGLAPGATLSLANGSDKLTVTANGNFVFPTKLGAGTGFSITANPPEAYSCKISNATGSIAAADSTSTAVACAPVLLAGAIGALQNPIGVTADGGGNLYAVDGATYSVVKFTPAGTRTTIAGGSDRPGFVDGPGAQARFRFGRGAIAADESGNLFIADTCNGAIRKISADGTVFTLAGRSTIACDNVQTEWTGEESKDGIGSAARFTFPTKLVADGAGGVIVVESAGTGELRRVSAAGVASSQPLFATSSGRAPGIMVAIARSRDDALYLAGTRRIYKLVGGILQEVAGTVTGSGARDGTGSSASFAGIRDIVAALSGDLYVVDAYQVRKVTPAGVVTTLAGGGRAADPVDGLGLAARFSSPMAIAVDGNSLVVADSAAGILRRVSFEGAVTTIAGASTRATVDGNGSAARLNAIATLSADADGNLYLAESEKQIVRKITPDGAVATFAGQLGVSGNADGAVASATFTAPRMVAAGRDGSLWVAQSVGLRRIQNGQVTTVDASIRAAGLVIDADGNAVVATGINGSNVARITPQGQKSELISAQQIRELLKNANVGFIPQSLAIDKDGNIYIADTGTVAVYKLAKSGPPSLFAGTPLKEIGDLDGPAGTATLGFYELDSMAIDDKGNLYLSGQGGVRMLSSAGIVSSPTYAWGQAPIAALAYSKGKLYGMTRFAVLQTWLP